jgi:hypothetical protein
VWVFSKTGFVSIVKHKYVPGSLMIRARVKEDLEQFVALLDEVSGSKHAIKETPDGDYAFRTTATKKAVAEVLSRQVNELDYTNFKNSVHGDPDRDSAYMSVWSAMYGLQVAKLGEGGQRWDNSLDFFGQEPEEQEEPEEQDEP